MPWEHAAARIACGSKKRSSAIPLATNTKNGRFSNRTRRLLRPYNNRLFQYVSNPCQLFLASKQKKIIARGALFFPLSPINKRLNTPYVLSFSRFLLNEI
jgi:hypothetical protein